MSKNKKETYFNQIKNFIDKLCIYDSENQLISKITSLDNKSGVSSKNFIDLINSKIPDIIKLIAEDENNQLTNEYLAFGFDEHFNIIKNMLSEKAKSFYESSNSYISLYNKEVYFERSKTTFHTVRFEQNKSELIEIFDQLISYDIIDKKHFQEWLKLEQYFDNPKQQKSITDNNINANSTIQTIIAEHEQKSNLTKAEKLEQERAALAEEEMHL